MNKTAGYVLIGFGAGLLVSVPWSQTIGIVCIVLGVVALMK